MDYPLSTGPLTLTADDLRDIVASQDDSAIRAPRLKLSRVEAHADAINEPSFGTATNLRLGDNDQTIYCDFEGVPAWLAEVMPVAYPSRSIEATLAVETVTGKKYRAVVTAVQLLGVEWPGISVLADLPLYYGSEQPEDVNVVEVAASTGGDPVSINAAVNVDDVRRSYYESIAGDAAASWWWIRAVQLSPMELIVDSDDGQLFRVPFKVKGEKITYEDPIEVKMEYVDIAASMGKEEKTAATSAFAAGLLATASQKPAVVFASRAESRPVTATQEGDGVQVDITQLRTTLGLPESSTEDEVLAAAQERIAASAASETESGGDESGGGEGGNGGEGEGEGEGEGTSTASVAATTVPDGMVLVDKETLATLKSGAEAGLRVEAKSVQDEDSRVLAAAIQEGRIPPARREHYASALKADRSGTMVLLTASTDKGGLAPGLVPVGSRVDGGDGGGETTVLGEAEGLPEHLFPELVRIRQVAASTRPGQGNVFQAKEG